MGKKAFTFYLLVLQVHPRISDLAGKTTICALPPDRVAQFRASPTFHYLDVRLSEHPRISLVEREFAEGIPNNRAYSSIPESLNSGEGENPARFHSKTQGWALAGCSIV